MKLNLKPPSLDLLLKTIRVPLNSIKFIKVFLFLFVLIGLLFLGIYKQPYYPTTWFDEGLVLQGAINLVKYGQYAMRSVEGFRVLDQPLTANGPGVVLPLSAVFAIWGIGLLQARILMAFYFAFGIILFYRVSSKIYGDVIGMISTLILLAVPEEGIFLYGRQALGNMPAFVYFLLGLYFFIKLIDRKGILYAFLSGSFWGLTLVTKSQYWIILPVLSITVLADLFYYKKIGAARSVIVIGTIVASLITWQFTQYLILGGESYAQSLVAIRSSAKVTVFALRAIRIPGNIWYLVRSGFVVIVIPGLTLAFFESRDRTPNGIVRLLLTLFVSCWIFWYAFVSVGWHRYAFEAYSIGTIFSGSIFIKALSFTLNQYKEPHKRTRYTYLTLTVIALFFLSSFSFVVTSGIRKIQRIIMPPTPYPQMLAEYLQKNIPPGLVIESWEWEIDALTPELTYHHPTNDWVDIKTAETQFGDMPDKTYDPFSFEPAYLIDGPFSNWTGIYHDSISKGCCVKVTNFGDYTLYKVINKK